VAKKKPKPDPEGPTPPTNLARCRRVLALAGLAVAEADRLSEAEQDAYAKLVNDQGEPTVPNLLRAVGDLRAQQQKT